MRKQPPWVTHFQFSLGAVILYALIALGLLRYLQIEPLGEGGNSVLTTVVVLATLVLGFGARAVFEIRRRREAARPHLEV